MVCSAWGPLHVCTSSCFVLSAHARTFGCKMVYFPSSPLPISFYIFHPLPFKKNYSLYCFQFCGVCVCDRGMWSVVRYPGVCPPRAGGTGGCKLSNMGAGNRIRCPSLLSHLSMHAPFKYYNVTVPRTWCWPGWRPPLAHCSPSVSLRPLSIVAVVIMK